MEEDIEILSDSDGFVILQCPLCGEYFKLTIDDVKSEETIEIWCPYCGLKSDDYVTEEVKEEAMKKVQNIVNDMIFNQFKKLERDTKGKMVTFKAGKKPKEEYVNEIIDKKTDLEIVKYKCCNKKAKVTANNVIAGGYCPFCGGIVDGN